MEPKKDIFDLFRESEHRLAERPSPAAWHKLERRLDARRRNKRLHTVHPLMMAAALLLVVGVISVFSLYTHRGASAALAGNTPAPAYLEDLSSSDSDTEALRVVAFSRQYQDRLSQPIVEGSTAKKLVPSAMKSSFSPGWEEEDSTSTRTKERKS